MVDGKSILLAAGIAVVLAAFGDTDAHKPVTYHFAVTNTADKVQKIESAWSSCACIKLDIDMAKSVAPNESLPFTAVFNPAGMEGKISKTVSVKLNPSGAIKVFTIDVDVRLRVGFDPIDATFGVVGRGDTGREIIAKLSGYAADDVKLGKPRRMGGQNIKQKENAQAARSTDVFDVSIALDGKSLIAKFRDRNVMPGIYSEVWIIPTNDPEIPEIKFPVTAHVTDILSVTPQIITMSKGDPVCSRMVLIRQADRRSGNISNSRFTVLSAETKPRKWGDIDIVKRPLNGWQIKIDNINPAQVAQFSKKPFLEVKTNLPNADVVCIPLQILNEGGLK